MTIVFAKPRFYYESYTDFWSLVELSDFEWCWIDQVDLKSNHTYIVSSVDFKRDRWHLSWWQWKRKRARLVLWDLERPKPRGGIEADRRLLARQHFDEIWASDPQIAKDLGTRFVILGSDEKLGQKPAWFKRYNFVPMAYVNGRRGAVLEKLKGIAPNCWGKDRQKILSSSRFGLTIHQDNDLYYEPLRLALFAAYELPVISETIYDPFPLDDCLLTCDYDRMIDYCNFCAANYRQFRQFGKELKQRLCFDYRFKNTVEYVARN